MAKKEEVKSGKLTEEQEKAKYVEDERKKIKTAQILAFVCGLLILGALLLIDFFISWYLKIWWQPLALMELFLVMYFIWAPQDVGWGSFAKEGYIKAVLLGGKRRRIFGVPSGEDYDEEWNIIKSEDFQGIRFSFFAITLTIKPYFDLVIWGMHIVYEWPFGTIYTEYNEWERYYPNMNKALPRKEVMREFSALPYPQYIKALKAEDANRFMVNLKSNVIWRMINPDKALFKETTSVIDIVKALLEGGYVYYIKSHDLKEILAKNFDIGADLMKDMLSPDSEYPGTLVNMLEKKYGIRILSISIIDIEGVDNEEDAAIKAAGLARLNKEATIINAEAAAEKTAIENMGAVVTMTSILTGNTKEDTVKVLSKDFAGRYNDSLDMAQRTLASNKNQFMDIRVGSNGKNDNQGSSSNPSMLEYIAVNTMMNRSGSGSSSSSGQKSPEEDERKKKRKLFKEAGFDVFKGEDDDE
jgi:hypothetical protein